VSLTQTPASTSGASPAPAPARSDHGGWRSWGRRYPFLCSTVVCLLLAALSAAVLPTVPSYDPWAWISWGREVVDPHLSFAVSGGPSWKPLPVFPFTTVYALFGSAAAPTLWVITARAGGLLGLVAAYRLAARLIGAPRWAAVAAGLVAAGGIVVTQEWFYEMFRGTSEPMLIACALWAIDRHLERRYGWAFVLGVATGLIRPEAWPFLIVYAVWLWVRQPRLRGLLLAGLFAIPFFWFVPPWVGSNQPFLAAQHAAEYNGALGKYPLFTVLRRGLDVQTIPLLVFGAVAVAMAWLRRPRDRLVLALGAGVVVWWVVVVGMTLEGYPGLERFYLPAAGVTCVLAGVGIVRLAELASAAVADRSAGGRADRSAGGGADRSGGGGADRSRRDGLGAGVGIAVVVALLALTIPFTGGRINEARRQNSVASAAVTRLDQLSAAVATVGGHDRVFPCKSSFAAVNHGAQTALAWKLHVTLGRVGTSMRHQGVMFVGPHDTIDGIAAPISPSLTQSQLLATVGAWRVYRVTAPGADQRCVGG